MKQLILIAVLTFSLISCEKKVINPNYYLINDTGKEQVYSGRSGENFITEYKWSTSETIVTNNNRFTIKTRISDTLGQPRYEYKNYFSNFDEKVPSLKDKYNFRSLKAIMRLNDSLATKESPLYSVGYLNK